MLRLLVTEPLSPLRAPALSDNALVRRMARVGLVVVLDGLVEGLGGRSPDITAGKRSDGVASALGSSLARRGVLVSVLPCAASFFGVCGSEALRLGDDACVFSPIACA